MSFVYYRLSETNPSGLLINLLQYFRFAFEFAEIFDCILGMRTDSSAYSQSVSIVSICESSKYAQQKPVKDLFRIFSVYIHTIELYTIRNESHRSISHRQRCRIEVSSCHPAFKRTLRQKWSEGELLDLKSNKKK